MFVFLYGVVAYAIFFATFLYAVGFVGNFIVPHTIDAAPTADFMQALLIDLGLLAIFAVQHSVMARKGFKRWITRFIPEAAERSTYVLTASAALLLLIHHWSPLGGVVWEVTSAPLAMAMHVACAMGWLLVLAATFLINHFDLFGLRQVWLHLNRRPYTPVSFRTPGPYRLVRHPLYLGFVIAFWMTPVMTVAHLLFAGATTAYILIAIQLEESDLVATLGDAYRHYRQRVPMLIPFLK